MGPSELVIRAEQQGLFVVPSGAEVAVAPGQGRPPAPLQCGLLGVLLIGWREVMDGILDHVSWIHGLLQAAGDALHGCAATCVEENGRVRLAPKVRFSLLCVLALHKMSSLRQQIVVWKV